MLKAIYSASILFALLISESVYCQKFNVQRLNEIALEETAKVNAFKSRLNLMRDTTAIPFTIQLQHNKKAFLTDYINGLPYYSTTHNIEARKTTGVEFVQSVNGLNLPLFGDGMTVAVFDGGLVRQTHQELVGRISNKFGSDLSQHATHVTGTIAAKGLNPQARGMAPNIQVVSYFGFENDLGNMAMEAAKGLILSNHSYGVMLGWDFQNGSWQWFGGESDVDLRFGHYSNNSKALDNIAFNAPNYTIVRSAGNDRSDVGNGTRPADGPFDCLGPAAVAKNVITVGAITGYEVYIDPNSAVMSEFSSWGPTDDGRIKPDIVADGVGVFSTGSSGDDDYVILQGTSMSSPNVTGSLAIIQEYFKSIEGDFMSSASLKALMIHTAKEAGSANGPDYKFGWGVLDAVHAIEFINGRNGSDTLMIERELNNDETHEFSFLSDGKEPITITLAWTDVPGNVGTQGSNELKLVNDLDVTLLDHNNNETLPWTLDPENPGQPARKGNNFRDNVEKIELPSPAIGRYTVRVSHKGNLVNAAQRYSIIISGSSIEEEDNDDIYWVSSSGKSNELNWSGNTGGTINEEIVSDNKTWIFDENSNISNNGVVQLSFSTSINNLIWTNKSNAILDLGLDTLTVEKRFIVDNENLKIINGVVVLKNKGGKFNTYNFDGSQNCRIVFENLDPIEIVGEIDSHSIIFKGDRVELSNSNLSSNHLSFLNTKEIRIENSSLHVDGIVVSENENLILNNNIWHISNGSVQLSENVNASNDVFLISNSRIDSNLNVGKLTLNGDIALNNQIITDSLLIESNSIVDLHALADIVIKEYLHISNSDGNQTTIRGFQAEALANIEVQSRNLLCFDNLNLTNISFVSESVMNVGLASNLVNVIGVSQSACEEVVFVDFELENNCANSVIQPVNKSKGPIEGFIWKYNNLQIEDVGDDSHPVNLIFNESGFYEVELIAWNPTSETGYKKIVEVVNNSLSDISIIENDLGLVASLSLNNYLWYKDQEVIDGANSRIFVPDVNGKYQVAYLDENSVCGNRVSGVFEYLMITSTSEMESNNAIIYPNPFTNQVLLENISDGEEVIVSTMDGKIVYQEFLPNNSSDVRLNLEFLEEGVYVLKVLSDIRSFNYKLIKK
ncbi:S8 family serine peptidase [Fulvivirga sp.]